jgi:hypothetical protein
MRVLIAEVAWLRDVISGIKATLEMAVPIDGAEATSEALIYEAITKRRKRKNENSKS